MVNSLLELGSFQQTYQDTLLIKILSFGCAIFLIDRNIATCYVVTINSEPLALLGAGEWNQNKNQNLRHMSTFSILTKKYVGKP